MSKKLYLFKTHRINMTNLFMGTLILNEGLRVYEPCTYSLVDNKFFYQNEGAMARNLVTNSQLNFRTFDWAQNLNILDQLVQTADSQNQILIFGSHNTDTINSIKQHLGDSIVSIGINYGTNMYPILLNNAAAYHVWLLQSGQSTPNEQDQINLNTLSHIDLIAYYASAFDQLSLFSTVSLDSLDYNIDVADFFDSSVFYSHFENLGFILTQQAKEYYSAWRSSSE